MNATDLALLLHMMREKFTPEQVVTELTRIHNKDTETRDAH